MPNTIKLTTTTDPATGASTGKTLVVIQLTPHYRTMLWNFLQDEEKYQHVNVYGAVSALAHVACGTPGIGGAVLTVAEACCIMESADDEVVGRYSTGERNLFKWLYNAIAELNLDLGD